MMIETKTGGAHIGAYEGTIQIQDAAMVGDDGHLEPGFTLGLASWTNPAGRTARLSQDQAGDLLAALLALGVPINDAARKSLERSA